MSWLNAALAGAFPKHNIPLCDRWGADGIHRSLAGFSRFPHAEKPADLPVGSIVSPVEGCGGNPVSSAA
jgi:hypothetical protein